MDDAKVASAIYLRIVGLSVTLRRTRCMGCKRAILGGEYRMAFPSLKMVGGTTKIQKTIMRYVCLSCAKVDLEDAIKTARTFRKKVIRKLHTDKTYYATRALGEEFQPQAMAIVKWRVDKIRAQRYNTSVKIKEAEARWAEQEAARKAAMEAMATETQL